ncbi:YggT family protein [bacterium]|nr:YggT family protein [bacterium]MBT3581373.1 YggT family protein [bacterium]MBT4551354.1 YggT family protein [bacterium]MBT5988587.1 YggT family protein [bacterium]MBT7088338.1 YggT family protein [bacterium]
MFLYKIIDLVFQGLYLALIVRIVLSWIPHDESHPIIQFLYKITDPILRPFQNIVPSYKLGIDISPIFAFIAISIVRRLLLTLLS